MADPRNGGPESSGYRYRYAWVMAAKKLVYLQKYATCLRHDFACNKQLLKSTFAFLLRFHKCESIDTKID